MENWCCLKPVAILFMTRLEILLAIEVLTGISRPEKILEMKVLFTRLYWTVFQKQRLF